MANNEGKLHDIAPYLTHHKLGKPVLTGSGVPGTFDSHAVDCPFVFRHNGMFHMLFVGFDGNGYQTGLAVSDDLITWRKRGVVLPREEHVGWDKVGAAGTWILKDHDLHGSSTLKKVDGKYWMIFHSYPSAGYEEGPAQMGLAWTDDDELMKWHRLPDPVFSWKDGDEWDKGGLYKACLIEEGGLYHLFYNAKNIPKGQWREQTGVATSADMMTWTRHPGNPVIRVSDDAWDMKFCSDPCVCRDGKRWVMFFFGFDGRHAQDGIAVSSDLLTWHKHPEPILRSGGPGEIDEIHAHKPAVIEHDGILYHFYCACRRYREGDPARNLHDEFRCISVATSKPLLS